MLQCEVPELEHGGRLVAADRVAAAVGIAAGCAVGAEGGCSCSNRMLNSRLVLGLVKLPFLLVLLLLWML